MSHIWGHVHINPKINKTPCLYQQELIMAPGSPQHRSYLSFGAWKNQIWGTIFISLGFRNFKPVFYHRAFWIPPLEEHRLCSIGSPLNKFGTSYLSPKRQLDSWVPNVSFFVYTSSKFYSSVILSVTLLGCDRGIPLKEQPTLMASVIRGTKVNVENPQLIGGLMIIGRLWILVN